MDTLKTSGLLSLLIIIILYSAEPIISIKPFSIKFNNGYYMIGFILIMIGLELVKLQGELNATKKFLEEYEIIDEADVESDISESKFN